MRFYIYRIITFVCLIILGVGLFKTQVLEGRRYRQLGEQNRIRLIPLEAPRGRVFDRQGKLLASNRASYNVVAMPEDVTPEVFPRLAKLLRMTETEVRDRVSGPREYPFAPAVIKEDIPRELAFQVEERKPELPGVSIRVSGLRFYPYGETASHVIGYIGKINPDEYRQFDRIRYGMQSLLGRAGIEKIYDDRLRGWRGGRQIEVNARGQLIRILSERLPETGEDLTVTLDLDFQQKIMEFIKDKHASVAVMDLKTEGLLALASSPAYDPNVFVSPAQGAERLQLLRDRESPMLDRGIGSAYPPGSVFKLVTALAGLETGKITQNTSFHCPGYFRIKPGSRPFKCWRQGGHGTLNLYQAVERSCNVYFYNVGHRLTPDRIAQTARELGLGERMELEVTNIAPGLVPDSAWKKAKYKEKWYEGETLSYAIGQSFLLTSPVQILRLVSIIAKEGEKTEPQLIIEKTNAKKDNKLEIAIKKSHLQIIKKSMLNVVESDYGTGQLARVDFDKIAAKTGTAQVPPKTAHSWIAGFFPYDNPEIAFVVFVEHGGSGGVTAAKVAKQMLYLWKEAGLAALA